MTFTRIELNRAEIDLIPRSAAMRHEIASRALIVLMIARALAPKRTGAGAGSIHADMLIGASGWEARISWDAYHKYMFYQNMGTKYVRAKHFLEQAVRMSTQGGDSR